ncbi:hypothetical protein E2562_030826, partial [Oryza meyeriana var. granulata]
MDDIALGLFFLLPPTPEDLVGSRPQAMATASCSPPRTSAFLGDGMVWGAWPDAGDLRQVGADLRRQQQQGGGGEIEIKRRPAATQGATQAGAEQDGGATQAGGAGREQDGGGDPGGDPGGRSRTAAATQAEQDGGGDPGGAGRRRRPRRSRGRPRRSRTAGVAAATQAARSRHSVSEASAAHRGHSGRGRPRRGWIRRRRRLGLRRRWRAEGGGART